MITRKFNRPLAHVRSSPLFWLHKVGVEWSCRKCGVRTKETVAFEAVHKISLPVVTGSHSGVERRGDSIPSIKSFLCLNCAEKLLEESLTKVRLCKTHGTDGYDMMTNI